MTSEEILKDLEALGYEELFEGTIGKDDHQVLIEDPIGHFPIPNTEWIDQSVVAARSDYGVRIFRKKVPYVPPVSRLPDIMASLRIQNYTELFEGEVGVGDQFFFEAEGTNHFPLYLSWYGQEVQSLKQKQGIRVFRKMTIAQMEGVIPLALNVKECPLCSHPIHRYNNRFECADNPCHFGDLNTGIITDHTMPTGFPEFDIDKFKESIKVLPGGITMILPAATEETSI